MIDKKDQAKKYDYGEAVAADIEKWCADRANAGIIREIVEGEISEDAAVNELRERLKCEDAITGNASGSRCFPAEIAKRCFCDGGAIGDNIAAIENDGIFSAEDCGKMIAAEEWDKLDVCMRIVAIDATDEAACAIGEAIDAEARRQGKEW